MSPRRELSAEEFRAAKTLAAGGRICARRTYPHPHKFWLEKADGWRYAALLPLSAVSELVRLRLIRVEAMTRPEPDGIDYVISERGVRCVDLGGEVPDEPAGQSWLLDAGSAA